ncbi:hypothetical protein P5673_009238 [Acropora cervicornis]|uniref:Uncharacterized protein n=1 Tax=Acropora cervicornis TaxID=6130 RepID=A0AAD9QS89_ACRCE|nr:hypothetical protein P5673_009238 [Acropora cervicornis]
MLQTKIREILMKSSVFKRLFAQSDRSMLHTEEVGCPEFTLRINTLAASNVFFLHSEDCDIPQGSILDPLLSLLSLFLSEISCLSITLEFDNTLIFQTNIKAVFEKSTKRGHNPNTLQGINNQFGGNVLSSMLLQQDIPEKCCYPIWNSKHKFHSVLSSSNDSTSLYESSDSKIVFPIELTICVRIHFEERESSVEYLSHDLDGSSKQSYSIFLKENKVTELSNQILAARGRSAR